MDSLPWLRAFDVLQNEEILKERAKQTVPSLDGLAALPLEQACMQLDKALRTVFYPTAQCVSILKRLIGVAHAHCMTVYPDSKTFLAGVYSLKPPLPEFALPICLTGLAGVGKTELLRAFRRVLDTYCNVMFDREHPFPISRTWQVTVLARSTPKDVLRTLCQSEGSPSALVEKCRKLAYRDSVSLLMADEFQFATGSESANARVSQMLLSLGYIGVPFVFAANYSLIRRLQRRPGEEQQRLLSSPIILCPDSPNSADWQNTLETQRDIAPDYFIFDPVQDAVTLHAYTAGRKRAMAHLLLLAFRSEYPKGGKVDCQALRRAYHSTEYGGYREETELLVAQFIQKRQAPDRKDLWCPFPLEADASVEFLNASIAAREARIAEAEITAALTQAERRAAIDLKQDGKKPANTGYVVHLNKKAKITADDLKRNANVFRDKL